MDKQKVLEKLKLDENYYGDFGKQFLSNSDIKTLLTNPLALGQQSKPSPAFLVGGYFHTAILEPDKLKKYKVIESSTRNTKAYKEMSGGELCLLQHEVDQIELMKNKRISDFSTLDLEKIDLQNEFIEYAWSWEQLKRGSYGLFKKYEKYDSQQNYTEKNTIRFAVDKFIGYCSLPYLKSSNRLNILIDNKIGLIDNNQSSIICGQQVWTMSEKEIEEFEKDDSYMWWKKSEN